MVKVWTGEGPERQKLQRECRQIGQQFIVGENQLSMLKEILSSISYQYFHPNAPSATQQILHFILEMLNSTCNLSNFRQLIATLKKREELLQFYEEYMSKLEEQFEDKESELILSTRSKSIMAEDSPTDIDNTCSYSQRYCFSQLMPYTSQFNEKDIVSQRTMESEILQCASPLISSSKSKLATLLSKQLSLVAVEWKTQQKGKKGLNESSKQISSFKKKGKNILEVNKIQELVGQQLKSDLRRQQNQQRQGKKVDDFEQYKYNKLVKCCLLKGKLKSRKNIMRSSIL